MSRITVDPRVEHVDVMAEYLPEPETARVDDNGVVRDDEGAAFDDYSYWVVAGSKEVQ